ncbi:MAG: NTP transferase domain-containing protein [Firmicutes bacterium]|nr:NTP transferase domain-containing protein [Bacillota bacterium]
MKVDAVVLAGAPNTGQLQEVRGEKWEAEIPISGKPMVNYVIEALQSSSRVGEIVVVAPAEIKDVLAPHIRWVEAGSSLTENIFRAMDVLDKKNNVLFVTSDVPFIHAEVIDDFVSRCGELQGEIFYPITSKEATEKMYPETTRTYFTLKEGSFTGGNILLAAPQAVVNSRWVMDEVISRRKKPWKIIRMLGFFFILKFLTKQLSLRELEQRASELLGHSGVLIISPYPELSNDVDKPSDLQLAEKTIAAVQDKEA